jgi:hypothetical protein
MSRFLVLAAAVVFAGGAAAEDKPQTWTGSIDDAKGKADASPVVVSEKAFKKLFESWMFDKELPKVDFEKNVVVVATTVGSKISGKPVLKDGNLTFPAISTRDIRPGFRYLIAVFPKEGVKTFNGKELPKE